MKETKKSAKPGAKPENEMRLRIPAFPQNEGAARAVVGAFVARLDPTVEELADLRCAVSEAVTNCVVHAYGGMGGPLYITVRQWRGRRITVEIRDRGRGIDDIGVAMQPAFTTVDTGERSGMGFAVMQTFCDEVRVKSTPGKGTSVTLIKRLSDPQEEM